MITIKKLLTKHLYSILCNKLEVDGPYKREEAIVRAKGYAKAYGLVYEGVEVKQRPKKTSNKQEKSLFKGKYK